MELAFDDQSQYQVVINHEEQYSIWPLGKPVPAGWSAVGVQGAKAACLEHIETVWTDMRPRSLREQMAAG
jgi:MbtH protein